MTGVSETTVRRRVDALFDQHVITQAVIPSLYQIGYQASAMVGIKADLNHVRTLAEQLARLPEVTFVALTMGGYDIMFFVAQSSLDELSRFMVECVAPLAGVREVETFVSPQVVKAITDWRLPLSGAEQGDRPERLDRPR